MTILLVVGAAAFLLGVCAGAALVFLNLRPRLKAAAQVVATLQAQLDEARVAQSQLAEMGRHLSSLRHDLRGILSPALLVADRLIGSTDPGVRRAGDVVIRTVERATTRLAESAQAAQAQTDQQEQSRGAQG